MLLNNKFKSVVLATAMLVGLNSCTKDFDKLNADPTRPTLDDPAIAAVAANGLFSSAISKGLMEAGEFQRVQALYADLYSQYHATAISYFNSDKYQMNQGWLDAGWTLFYPRDISNLVAIINSKYSSNNQKQIARIWKVFLFHRMVDFYGDIPYFNAGDPTKAEKWDSQQAIYTDFFKELTEADKALDLSVAKSFDDKDVIYKGATAKWKAFGNSLRLRLAMRISKVDPAKAQTEAAAAIAAGVFASNSDNAFAAVNPILYNALNRITEWGEFRMSATMESLLVGTEDPRLPELMSPVEGTDVNYKGKFRGVLNALPGASFGIDDFKSANVSNVGPRFRRVNEGTNPRIVLTYAEMCFHIAECKLNGWNVSSAGTTQDWYEKGIKASMAQFGIAAAKADAFVLSTKVPSLPAFPADYTDKRPVSTLPAKFSAVAAEQREQISIQRYLAEYPDSFEGWSEFRRTGFPKLYKPAAIDPTSDVAPGQMIQRIPYTDNMRALNKDGVGAAESRMGVSSGLGQGVKLWFAGGK